LVRAIEWHAQWLAGPADRRQFPPRFAGCQRASIVMTNSKITELALRGKGA
jgi:hypothetical protein